LVERRRNEGSTALTEATLARLELPLDRGLDARCTSVVTHHRGHSKSRTTALRRPCGEDRRGTKRIRFNVCRERTRASRERFGPRRGIASRGAPRRATTENGLLDAAPSCKNRHT